MSNSTSTFHGWVSAQEPQDFRHYLELLLNDIIVHMDEPSSQCSCVNRGCVETGLEEPMQDEYFPL